MKKEFQYEDDVPKKNYGNMSSGGGGGSGWDEVKRAKTDFSSKPNISSGSGAGGGSNNWNQPPPKQEKQEAFGGFSGAFGKFDYNR